MQVEASLRRLKPLHGTKGTRRPHLGRPGSPKGSRLPRRALPGKQGRAPSPEQQKQAAAAASAAQPSWRQMLPGDSGWDLLKLRKSDAKTFNRFREAEVIHARWAMLGVISLLVGDVAGSPFPPRELSLSSVAPWGVVLLLSLGVIETYRLAALWNEPDFEKRAYPGKRFDVLRLTQPAARQQDEAPPGLGVWSAWVGGLPGWLAGGWWFQRKEMTEFELLDMKSKELRNGRLAMVSFMACCMATALTGKGPLSLLVEALADPGRHDAVANLL